MLKAKHKRSYYKTDTGWLNAIYRANKDYIDANMNEKWKELYGNSQRAFRNLVKEQMLNENPKTGRKYTINQAINRVENSKDLHKDWTSRDVTANNFKQLFKKDKKLAKEFREQTKEPLTRFDPKKLEFEGWYNEGNKAKAVYRYGDTYIIESVSPDKSTGASIRILTKFQFEAAEGKTLHFMYQHKPRKR